MLLLFITTESEYYYEGNRIYNVKFAIGIALMITRPRSDSAVSVSSRKNLNWKEATVSKTYGSIMALCQICCKRRSLETTEEELGEVMQGFLSPNTFSAKIANTNSMSTNYNIINKWCPERRSNTRTKISI